MNFLKCKYIPNIAWDITLHYPKNCPSSIWNLNVPVFKPQIFRGAYLYWKLFTVYLKSKFKWVSCYVTSGRATACTYSGMKETDRALSEAPCHLKQWSTLRKKSTLLQLARQGFHGLAHSLPPFPHSFPTRALHSSWDRPISDLRKGPKCLTIPHSGTKICNALPAPPSGAHLSSLTTYSSSFILIHTDHLLQTYWNASSTSILVSASTYATSSALKALPWCPPSSLLAKPG